jgi:hypothetical protein
MKTGIMGFFDILGYQSFLKNNPGDAARRVVSKLGGLEQSLAAEMREALLHKQKAPKVEELLALLKCLVFSDTVMLYSPFDDGDSVRTRSNRWIVMNFACILLWRRMFEFGLPLRGVLHTGEFLVEKACFAGRAIVEAYQISQDFDLAVCAYTRAAFDELVRQANEPYDPLLWNWIPTQLFEYRIPRMQGTDERLVTINPLALFLEGHDRYFNGDLRQLVHDAFWKHGKDIPESAASKLLHTEQFLRACRFTLSTMEESIERMLRFQKKPREGRAPGQRQV